MVGDLYDANNVVVGNAVLWLAPYVSTAVTPLVADTVDVFDASSWPSPWIKVGATNEGFKLNVETSTTTIMIEEQITPVTEAIEGKTLTIEAALAEASMQSLKFSFGGSAIVTTAATPTLPATSKMTLQDLPQFYTAALEMRNYKGLARRIYIPKASLTGSGEISFRRAADKQTFPIRLASLSAPKDIQIVDITAPKTA